MTQEREELHLKYRPLCFDEYIGGEALKEAIISNLPATHVFAFRGQRGCGKTTLARLIAKHLDIHERDIHEIDAADKTGIDDARQIKTSVSYSPMGGKNKIYVIDECHRLTGNAWDSLLKTLEEPPRHCYFVLCTTDWNKVPITVRSRCKSFEVKPLLRRQSKHLINWICENESINIHEKVENVILNECDGIPREIIIAIDTVKSIKDPDQAIELIVASKYNSQIIDLCQALIKRSSWDKITKIIKGLNEEPENIRYAVLGYMNSILLNEDNPQAAFVMINFSDSFIYTKKSGLTIACYQSTRTN